MLTRAIVWAGRGVRSGAGDAPPCLRLLVDRSWLQHVVEQLVLGGIREIDVLFDGDHPAAEREIEGEERWGATVRCHRPSRPSFGEALEAICAEPEVLLADAAVLVAADVWAGPRPAPPLLEAYHAPRADGGNVTLAWTGWCRGAGHKLGRGVAFESDGARFDDMFSRARATSNRLCVALSAQQPRQILEANRFVLSGGAPWVFLRGLEAPPRVWMERGVRIHATARLVPPVYLGELVRVGPGAVVGPHAVLGAGCIVGESARVRDCVLPPATYVAGGPTCERLVGLGAGEFRSESSEVVSGELARTLVALDTVSFARDLRRCLDAALVRMLALVEAPARRARELVGAWTRARTLTEHENT